MMKHSLGVVLSAALLVQAVPALALDILSGSEIAERERKRRLQAKPVLSCAPLKLSARAVRGDTAELRLTIRNGGGQVLRWSLSQLPPWLAADVMTGELKFEGQRTVMLHVRTQLVRSDSDVAQVLVEAPGADGSPARVSVAVEVKPAPVMRASTRPMDTVGAVADTPLPIARIPLDSAPARGGLGVRVGFMLPGSGTATEYESSPFFGLQYRMRGDSSKFSLELGLDYTSSDAESAGSSSTLTSGRADVLFHMGKSGGLYLLSGLGALLESSDVSGSSKAGLLDVGAGMVFVGGKLDVRLTHAMLLGGDNVSGMTLLSTAYHF
jgi:hypothetical protein